MKFHKLNNIQVKPLQGFGKVEKDKRPILGSKLFPEIYSNIFICARKKSGKTILVQSIIRQCAGRDTRVIVISSTIHKDENHINLKNYLERKGISYTGFTSMKQEDGSNIIDELINSLQEVPELEEEEEETTDNLLLYGREEETEKKVRKSKYRAPEYIIFLDDLSTELKSKSLVSLLKKNRHFKMKVIMSSQYIHDLDPQSLKQLDYFLAFKGLSDEKLKKIYTDLDLGISLPKFKYIYEHSTKERFNFLYVDVVNDKFRRNFNYAYSVF